MNRKESRHVMGDGIRESGEGDGGGVCRKLTTVSATGQKDRIRFSNLH